MLRWQEGYRVGENVRKPEKIKRRLDAGKYVHGIYLLTLSENPANIMDVIPADMLIQKSFCRICPPIIGMAGDKEEALEMVKNLVDEVYRATGAFRITEYIENR